MYSTSFIDTYEVMSNTICRILNLSNLRSIKHYLFRLWLGFKLVSINYISIFCIQDYFRVNWAKTSTEYMKVFRLQISRSAGAL
jgi:hypothetical protein